MISGLIRTIDNIEERVASLSDSESQETINEAKDNLLIALESQNVDQFTPQVGAVYKEYARVAQAQRQTTDTPEKIGTIAAVIAPGYKYIGGETEKIVRHAKVAVYVAKSDSQEGVNE